MRSRRPVQALTLLAGLTLALAGCSGGGAKNMAPAGSTAMAMDAAQSAVATSAADWKPVADALGRTGTMQGGVVYRVPLVRKDLTVTTDGVAIKPGLSLGGYAALAKYADGTMLMADLVVTETELPRVTDALQAAGLEQTAIHKHLLSQTPAIWWTHVHGMGDPVTLAKGLKTALAATGIPAASTAPAASQPPVELDTAALDTALGRRGTADGGLYKYTIARRQPVSADGHVLPSQLGITTGITFQPLGSGKAAINGDIVMTAGEVQHVIAALRAGGIEVVELHNHGLDESPRLFYLHFWANSDAGRLAKTLRAAVDATDAAPPTT